MRLLRRARDREAGGHEGGAAVTTVAVDALGADAGVAEVVAGSLAAARSGMRCLLCGPIDELLAACGSEPPAEIVPVDAPEEITNSEEPAKAVRSKPEASIVRAAAAVADGEADALVSAGPTGATLAAALLRVRRIPGVYRPAIAVGVPVPGRHLLLLDVGANTEVRPEQLEQFAFMGACFCQGVLGIAEPEVGLLSVGAETGKGTPLVVETGERLAAGPLRFVGNVEGNDLTAGVADVIVTDGFTGNVALKAIEGTVATITNEIRARIRSGTLSKLGGLMIRRRLRGLRDELDPDAVGGAYLLGLRSPVVICHGASSRRAIASAIALAGRGVEQDVVAKTAAALERAGIARGSGSEAAQQPGGEPVSASVTADSVDAR